MSSTMFTSIESFKLKVKLFINEKKLHLNTFVEIFNNLKGSTIEGQGDCVSCHAPDY